MAEVKKKVSGKMQRDTVGGVVHATYEIAVTRNKAGGSSFTGKIGATKAGGLVAKEVRCSFTGEISVAKEVRCSFTGEIGVAKASSGNKKAGGSSTSDEIGVTKVEPAGNKKEAGGSSTSDEIGVTKAEPSGNKKEEAGGSSTGGEIGGIKAELIENKVTESSWIDYVILFKEDVLSYKKALEQARKDEPVDPMITKEKVPGPFIDILTKRRPLMKLPPMTDGCYRTFSKYNPKLRDDYLAIIAKRNCCVDLHNDVLRQYKEKGFAEVGVDLSGGDKRLFVLPA